MWATRAGEGPTVGIESAHSLINSPDLRCLTSVAGLLPCWVATGCVATGCVAAVLQPSILVPKRGFAPQIDLLAEVLLAHLPLGAAGGLLSDRCLPSLIGGQLR